MKELSNEDKAKRYDEAIEIAKEINNEKCAQPFNVMTRVFPELKESKDEKIRKVIYGWIYTQPSQFFDSGFSKEEMLTWLKSLKDRVQPNREWSKEDEVKINRIVACLENLNVADNDILLKDVDWLKSLRSQTTWKPSDSQMASITCAVRKMKESACYDSELVSLLDDLKKLK